MNDTYKIPVNSPFLAQMMPRIGVAVRIHGEQIGLSQQCIGAGQKNDQLILTTLLNTYPIQATMICMGCVLPCFIL